jgi:hypothetical protein
MLCDWLDREELLGVLLQIERDRSICEVKLELINLTPSETDPTALLLTVYLGGTTLFFHLAMEPIPAETRSRSIPTEARSRSSKRNYSTASHSTPTNTDEIVVIPDGDE